MIELQYLDRVGRGLPIRLALLFGGIEFKDTRFSAEEFKNSVKQTTPLGQVPLLIVDGVVHTQSGAIIRYVGMKSGLYSVADPESTFLVDEALCIMDDLRADLRDCVDRASFATLDSTTRALKHLSSVFDRLPSDKLTIAHLTLYSEWVVGITLLNGPKRGFPVEAFRALPALKVAHDLILASPPLARYFKETHASEYVPL